MYVKLPLLHFFPVHPFLHPSVHFPVMREHFVDFLQLGLQDMLQFLPYFPAIHPARTIEYNCVPCIFLKNIQILFIEQNQLEKKTSVNHEFR